ncbi:MAG: recombination protein RecR [Alphaproteobacteria bacterium]|nr:recombination protein RecR [Alphaproteobacteria bacterium]MCB9928865.1 recombination protein RecR [Alphaproteobacteria bacterium]
MADNAIEHLIRQLARLPGLGPRSARRIALHLLQRRESALQPLLASLTAVAGSVRPCGVCRNLDLTDPCSICADPARDRHALCVVETLADLWALERSGSFRGRYHVLGGLLSALDRVGPEDLGIGALIERASAAEVTEVVLALGATVDGQTTAHYLSDALAHTDVRITRLAHGVPVGGALEYLDDGTLSAAMRARRPL